MQDSRFHIHALLNILPRTSNTNNLDAFTGHVMEAFRVFRENLPQPDEQTVAANSRVYGYAQVNAMLKATRNNIIDQICMAFLVHFLPPNL